MKQQKPLLFHMWHGQYVVCCAPVPMTPTNYYTHTLGTYILIHSLAQNETKRNKKSHSNFMKSTEVSPQAEMDWVLYKKLRSRYETHFAAIRVSKRIHTQIAQARVGCVHLPLPPDKYRMTGPNRPRKTSLSREKLSTYRAFIRIHCVSVFTQINFIHNRCVMCINEPYTTPSHICIIHNSITLL